VSRAVLLIADLFHPVDDFAVERFLNGDVHLADVGRCKKQ
jgi:hypothetical protein